MGGCYGERDGVLAQESDVGFGGACREEEGDRVQVGVKEEEEGCISVVFTELYFVQGEMKNSQGTKRIDHIIKLGVSRKRGGELSNIVLTLVRLRNDFIEG
jgi:hypothetical protein